MLELGGSQSDALDQGVLAQETGGYLSSLFALFSGRREGLRNRDGAGREERVKFLKSRMVCAPVTRSGPSENPVAHPA